MRPARSLPRARRPPSRRRPRRRRISRTTAYRYFPSQRALLATAFPEIETVSLLPPDASDDPVERFDPVVELVTRQVIVEPRRSSARCFGSRSRPTPRNGRSCSCARVASSAGSRTALRPLRARVPEDGVAAAGARDACDDRHRVVCLADRCRRPLARRRHRDDALVGQRVAAADARVRRRSTVAGEVVVDDADAHRTLADRGGDALDRSAPHVTDREYAGHP